MDSNHRSLARSRFLSRRRIAVPNMSPKVFRSVTMVSKPSPVHRRVFCDLTSGAHPIYNRRRQRPPPGTLDRIVASTPDAPLARAVPGAINCVGKFASLVGPVRLSERHPPPSGTRAAAAAPQSRSETAVGSAFTSAPAGASAGPRRGSSARLNAGLPLSSCCRATRARRLNERLLGLDFATALPPIRGNPFARLGISKAIPALPSPPSLNFGVRRNRTPPLGGAGRARSRECPSARSALDAL